MTLKESIKSVHDLAEHHPLAQSMVKGRVAVEAYADLLANLIFVYGDLESKARKMGCITSHHLSELPRFQRMVEDLIELTEAHNIQTTRHLCLPLLSDYCDSIWAQTQEGTMAHLYVHHMGDLFGGQILKRVLPGKCSRYDFDNRQELIEEIRSHLTDTMADQAIAAFEFVIGLYDHIAEKHNIH